jgi:anti-sigma regulatory factor (Ser/Thr protein kinase)
MVVSTEKSFAKTLQSLEGIFDFLEGFINAESLGERDAFALNLVVEELFTNMVKYSGGEDHQVAVRLERSGPQIDLQLTDFDSDAFDPSGLGEVDVHAPIEDRRPGGLGIHIVRTMVESLEYEMNERVLTISAVRRLES